MRSVRRTRLRQGRASRLSRAFSILLAGTLHAAWPGISAAALRTLYVDHDSRGGPCNDGYTATQNAAASPAGSKPWCTLGAAGRFVQAGDLVLVRGGTYGERMMCDGNPPCSGQAVLELVKKGTAQNQIVYRAYPGETPIIDPGAQVPRNNPADYGLLYGIAVASVPVGGGANDYYTVIVGFKVQHWNFYDSRLAVTPTNHIPSQYAVAITNAAGRAGHITVQNCELANNDGGGVFYTKTVYAVTLQYSKIHDNHTHGWTSPVNLWEPAGKRDGQNVVRGNVIYGNRDTPPLWCLQRYCTDPGVASHTCEDNVHGYGKHCPCFVDANCQSGTCASSANGSGCSNQVYNVDGNSEGHGIILDTGQGQCAQGTGLESTICTWAGDGVCSTRCVGAGTPLSCCTGAGTGNCCTPGIGASALIESNVIFNNAGECINVFKTNNVIVRNNTCYRNGTRGRKDDNEISSWGGNVQVFNNVVEALGTGECSCTTDADCGGAAGTCQSWSYGNVCLTGPKSACTSNADCPSGTCVPHAALSLAYGGSIYLSASGNTIAEG